MKTYNLEIKKIKAFWAIVAGVAVLAKFKTESAATKALSDNRGFYQYWAGSISVSVQNSKTVVINA